MLAIDASVINTFIGACVLAVALVGLVVGRHKLNQIHIVVNSRLDGALQEIGALKVKIGTLDQQILDLKAKNE